MNGKQLNAPESAAVPSTRRSPSADDDQVTLRDLILAVWSRRWLAVSVVAACTCIALGIALLLPPIYQAQTLLAPASESSTNSRLSMLNSQFGGIASIAGVSLNSGSPASQEAFAVLKSRSITNRFVEMNKLLPVLFADDWDPESQQWTSEKPKTLWDAYALFDHKVRTATEDKKTGLVTLSIEWKDPVAAAAWTNELVALTNQTLRDRQIERSNRNLAYLKKQLEITNVSEVRQAIYRLVESEVKSVMLAQGDDEFAYRVLDPAVVPERKAKPHRLLIVVAGFLAGGVLAVLLALALGPSRREID